MINFICGYDNFIIKYYTKKLFKKYSNRIGSNYEKEIISGNASDIEQVNKKIIELCESIQTISLFNEKKLIWFKDVSFLNDLKIINSKIIRKRILTFLQILETIDLEKIEIIINAYPVDQKREELKWFQKNTCYKYFTAQSSSKIISEIIESKCKKMNIQLTLKAKELLIKKNSKNIYMILEEIYTRDNATDLDSVHGKVERVVDDDVMSWRDGALSHML